MLFAAASHRFEYYFSIFTQHILYAVFIMSTVVARQGYWRHFLSLYEYVYVDADWSYSFQTMTRDFYFLQIVVFALSR